MHKSHISINTFQAETLLLLLFLVLVRVFGISKSFQAINKFLHFLIWTIHIFIFLQLSLGFSWWLCCRLCSLSFLVIVSCNDWNSFCLLLDFLWLFWLTFFIISYISKGDEHMILIILRTFLLLMQFQIRWLYFQWSRAINRNCRSHKRDKLHDFSSFIVLYR